MHTFPYSIRARIPRSSIRYTVSRMISTSLTISQANSETLQVSSTKDTEKEAKQLEKQREILLKRQLKAEFSVLLQDLPQLTYPKHYKVECINTEDKVNTTLREFLKSQQGDVFGVDFEWPPTFIKGQPEKKISLVQICSSNAILLVQTTRMKSFPKELQRFFEDRDLLKTGVNIRMDGLKLHRDFGIKTNGLVELMSFANASKLPEVKKYHMRSLRALTAFFLKRRMAKGDVRISNWAVRSLTPKQISYAALDAYASYQIYQAIKKEGIKDIPIIHLEDAHLSRPKSLEKKEKKQEKQTTIEKTLIKPSNTQWRPSSTVVVLKKTT